MTDIQLDTPVQFLKGVGPKISSVLAKKDIHRVGDALQWFPRTYEDRKSATAISDLQVGQLVSFVAQLGPHREIPMGRSVRRLHEVIFHDKTGRIAGKWFRVPFKNYFSTFTVGGFVRVTGEIKVYRGIKEIHHPDVKLLGPQGEDLPDDHEPGLLPIYSETEGLNQKLIRKIISNVIAKAGDLVQETMPPWILDKYKLPSLKDSLVKVHNPGEDDPRVWQEFRDPHQKRLIFEEFFWMELLVARSRAGIVREAGPSMKAKLNLSAKIRKAVGFSLTHDQEKCLADITGDLLSPHPMNRLVQGDVGCGKTIVSFLASALAIENGYQVALMAPTEILAEQHFAKAKDLFEKEGVKVALVTGGPKNKKQEEVKSEVAGGNISLVVGTHALLEGNVQFKNLGLVIIDEQHRFGVKQRSELKKKGVSPHFLVMTATPIPRTLAMTVYGDLDVSVIRELPQGRLPITTRSVFENKREQVYTFVREQLTRGRQAYVIYPLVEETEKMDLKNATDMAEVLTEELKPHTVGLLHGRLKSQEKDQLMQKFKAGEIKVLVSTTVVEVGVDVPNASVMLIEHAERFGLAQLHQLRGRVGRGAHKSYCILLAGRALSDEARRRLEVMVQTQDGFKIAEEDLVLRGPGEFLGTRQSGLPGFRMANLVRDVDILNEARKAAFEILARDPELNQSENQLLREAVVFNRKPALLFASIG